MLARHLAAGCRRAAPTGRRSCTRSPPSAALRRARARIRLPLPLTGIATPSRLAVDELAVRDSPRSVAGRADHAVFDGELACGNIELRRRQGQQRPPAVRRGLPKLRAGESDRQAAHGRPLVDAARGVAHDHLGHDRRARRAPRRRSARAPSGCPGRAPSCPVNAVTVPSAWIASHESSDDGSSTAGHVVGASLAATGDAPHGRRNARSRRSARRRPSGTRCG